MKVLVVDDSVVFRTAIKTSLAQSPEVTDVAVAGNGKIAVDKLKQDHFDAMTLDLEMPVMDGVETIKAVREFNKDIVIIIFSAQNLNAANKTLTALEMGANDFVQKIEGSGDLNDSLKMIQSELVPKFKVFIDKIKARARKEMVQASAVASRQQPVQRVRPSTDYKLDPKPSLLCIGSSTGGPETLKKIFRQLKPGIETPILLVQHMPPVFTTQLAKSLNDISSIGVSEAKDGDVLMPGHCYLAPGDYHMELINEEGNYTIRLNQNEKVCYVRPAVDVLLKSVCQNFKGRVGTFILTGMGSDGADGCIALKNAHKGPVVIQEEESCVVFGMPKAVFDLGIYDDMVDIEGVARVINDLT